MARRPHFKNPCVKKCSSDGGSYFAARAGPRLANKFAHQRRIRLQALAKKFAYRLPNPFRAWAENPALRMLTLRRRPRLMDNRLLIVLASVTGWKKSRFS